MLVQKSTPKQHILIILASETVIPIIINIKNYPRLPNFLVVIFAKNKFIFVWPFAGKYYIKNSMSEQPVQCGQV